MDFPLSLLSMRHSDSEFLRATSAGQTSSGSPVSKARGGSPRPAGSLRAANAVYLPGVPCVATPRVLSVTHV